MTISQKVINFLINYSTGSNFYLENVLLALVGVTKTQSASSSGRGRACVLTLLNPSGAYNHLDYCRQKYLGNSHN